MRSGWAMASLMGLVALAASSVACGDSAADGEPGVFTGTEGAALFEQACASCRGADLQGTDTGPPLLHEFYVPGHHSDQAFLLAVLNGARSHHWGFGDMPRVEGIAEEQVLAIVEFVRQRQAGFE